MQYVYPVTFQRDQNGTIIALVPDVPGTMTFGANRDEALDRVQGALVAMLAARMEDQETIPRPSRAGRRQRVVALQPVVAAKISIYQAMRVQQSTPQDLARRLGWEESRMRRVLDLRRRSRLEDIEASLAALGKRLVIEVKNVAQCIWRFQ
jgi:antitoxin HicB